MTSRTIVMIDDDPNVIASVDLLLGQEGYRVLGFQRWNEATRAAITSGCALVLLDMYIGPQYGGDVLSEMQEADPLVPVLVLSGQAGPEEAVAAVRAGAFDFIEKPFAPERLIMAAANATRFRDLKARILRDAMPIRESPSMRALCALATRYAKSSAPVLITGESGTGKDMLAGLVHGLSPRASAAFVKINCGAIPKDLADSELFGHARGAFTGADKDYEGRMAPADGGTLFLDEVGELPAGVQVKLLRFLETGEFQRPGDSRPRRIDARVIAATNRDLATAVRSGDFREDLYFRLNVLSLAVPPLRERSEDILPLARWFIDAAAAKDGSRPPSLSDGAERTLLSYPFPGNARELRNVIERIVCVADSGLVDADTIETAIGARVSGKRLQESPALLNPLARLLSTPMNLAAAKDALELEYIRSILSMNGGSIKDTASALGVLPNNLSRRLKQLEAGS